MQKAENKTKFESNPLKITSLYDLILWWSHSFRLKVVDVSGKISWSIRFFLKKYFKTSLQPLFPKNKSLEINLQCPFSSAVPMPNTVHSFSTQFPCNNILSIFLVFLVILGNLPWIRLDIAITTNCSHLWIYFNIFRHH